MKMRGHPREYLAKCGFSPVQPPLLVERDGLL